MKQLSAVPENFSVRTVPSHHLDDDSDDNSSEDDSTSWAPRCTPSVKDLNLSLSDLSSLIQRNIAEAGSVTASSMDTGANEVGESQHTMEFDVRTLSKRGRQAMTDFITHLRMMGKSFLDLDGFNILLDTMGYNNDRNGLFEALLQDIDCAREEHDRQSTASKTKDTKKASTIITVEDMFILYSSTPYHLLDVEDVGEALMKSVDELFNKVDVDQNDELDYKDIDNLITMLIGRPASKEETVELFDVMDKSGKGAVCRQELKQAILKMPPTKSEGIPVTFNITLLDPGLVSNEEFVSGLENYCMEHSATNHHLLENIACGAFGKKETADVILRFLTAYKELTKGFIAGVEGLVRMLDNDSHRSCLKEKITEELGVYDKETLETIEKKLGIDTRNVEFIPHKDLFDTLVTKLEHHLRVSYNNFVPEDLVRPYQDAKEHLSTDKYGKLALIYFGSELIVPKLYSRMLQGLELSTSFNSEDLVFFHLHIDTDQDHADSMRKIVLDFSNCREERLKLVVAAEMILQARVSFYNVLVKQMNFQDKEVHVSTFYDEQSESWCRDKPRCISDFTGRPLVFDLCRDKVSMGAVVLDIGCGDGYVARALTKMGASKVVGIDITPSMIENAISKKKDGQYFLVGDAKQVKKSLQENFSQANLVLGQQFEAGAFDLAVAVFLFDNMSITEMNSTMQDVYSLLKPGGEFVISVPHPFMAHHDNSAFGFRDGKNGSYFSQRDQVLDGHISTVDGKSLNVRMHFKTFDDYISSFRHIGYDVVDVKEARATPEHIANPALSKMLESAKDVPLHLVIRAKKPTSDGRGNLSSASTVEVMPKKLLWNNLMKRKFCPFVTMSLPDSVNRELIEITLKCYKDKILIDDIVLGKNVSISKGLKEFCATVRRRILHETGAIIIKGLDMNVLGGVADLNKMTECSRIAYYLVSSHIGVVDGAARGRLFDVKNAKIDAMDKKKDNVLFSVSDSECGWHTDGASRDRVYDVVALMCISPAKNGGKFRVSNACNAFDAVKKAVPGFMMYELTRPIPRDILENGKGKGSVGLGMCLSRSSALLPMRIRYNSYPIYATSDSEDRMRFRYMRHWIETGHEKTNWKVPTLLRIAMDILDEKLDDECCFYRALSRGEMIFANNAMLAHARDSFKDFEDGDGPPRHLLRAWLQIQKADL